MSCTPIKVDLEVVTPDQLRKIAFGLERDCNNDGTESWTIHFELDEAATAGGPFHEVVKLDVMINPENNGKAASTALHGLDNDQTSQAFVAADTAKAYRLGQASCDDVASDTEDVIAARSDKSPV
jgi:hypothetical protein